MIKIGEKWIVDADTMCYILKEKKVIQRGDNAGGERIEINGYFSSIPEALKRIYDTEVMEKIANNNYDLKSAIAEMHSIREMVKQDIEKAEVVNG